MTGITFPASRRLIAWAFIGVMALALLLTLGDSGTAAFEAGAPEAPRNLNVSPGESRELAVSWEAPHFDGGTSAESTAAPGPALGAVHGPVSIQFAGPNDDSDEDEVFTWYDGDRTMRVRLLPGAAQKPGASTDQNVASRERSGAAGPVFRSESGGELMTLPGGVLLVLDPSWTASDVDEFFFRNGIAPAGVTELAFAENAYFLDTQPGFPSLRLANALAIQEGVEISSPNWSSMWTAEQDGSDHDPGDTIEKALDLPLNTRINATLHGRDDLHFYKVELHESTLVLLANLDTSNKLELPEWVLLKWLDTNGLELEGPHGWKVRRLDAGVYYIRASVNPGARQSGQPYNIQAITIPDHGDASDSAAPLRLMPFYDDPHWRDLDHVAHGDFHSLDDADFYKVEISAATEVVAEVNTTWAVVTGSAVVAPVSVDVFDADANLLYPHVPGLWSYRISAQSNVYRLEAGTYYFRLSPYEYNSEYWQRYPPYYQFRIHTDAEYNEFIADCTSIETAFDDPLLGCQDHLISQQAGGVDINVADVWATNKGEGVNVAVVDRDLEGDHEDLQDNVIQTFSFDYAGAGEPLNPVNYHGTAVAGIIAARDNDLGGRGVAPRAGIYSYNLLEEATLGHMVDAMTRNMGVVAISNNSWGIRSGGTPRQISRTWTTALETGVSHGFGGKGIFYVFSAGNSHGVGSHVNLTEFRNFYAQTPVCVVDSGGKRLSYSETGYALWICAPIARMTTDNRNRYQDGFGGTSSAAPVVSGVAALVRSENTSLTWRDVKLILAASARKNDPANSGWETGALRYGSETERYSYNPEYGFGVVDAKAAVDLAESWTNLPAMKSVSAGSGEMELQVPDPADGPGATQLVSDLTLGSDVGFTEFVEVEIDFDHEGFLDLEIEIRSPAGTVSRLAVPNESFVNNGARNSKYRARFVPLQGKFRFGSARHLGEDPTGVWTLRVRDGIAGNRGSIKGWSIKVYGHGEGVEAPALSNTSATGLPAISGTVQVGETLSADLSAIGDWDGLSTATFSYQWIRSDGNTETDIQDSTDSTYILRADDEGKSIRVRVTFTDDAANEEALTSPPTAAVAAVPLPAPDVTPDTPVIPGPPDTPEPSGATAVHVGRIDLEWSDVPGADSYEVQLFRNAWFDLPGNGIEIAFYGPGAIVSGLDRESRYYFRVRAHNALGSSDWSEHFFMQATGVTSWNFDHVPEPTNSAATGSPTIRRVTDRVSILSASLTDIEDENRLDRVWFHYQWIFSDGTTNTDIEGATDATYTLRADDWGKSIKVRVTFTDRGGYQETLTSAAFGFDDDFPGICGRTAQVREAILDELADIEDCSLVSASHLNGIGRLNLTHPDAEDIAALQAGDFEGLFNLYRLDLDHNELTGLPGGVFDNLHNLEHLSLSYNGLTELPGGVFDNLHSLEHLSLGANELTGLPGGVFDSLQSLQYLYLNGNDLTGLREGVFDSLHSLEDLHLNRNDLTELPEGVFDSLHSLEDLSLSSNYLTELPEGLFDNLHSLERADFGANLGGPFTFTAQLEWQGDDAVIVKVAGGAPFRTRATLFAQGGTLSTSAVTLDAGSLSSEEVTVTPDGEETVTISVVWAGFLPGVGADDLSVIGIRIGAGWPVALPGVGLPVVNGSAQVGETLAVDTSGITDLNGVSRASYSYQWIRNGGAADTDIEDETNSTYELSDDDVGKTIKVRVTFTDDDGNSEERTSAATEPVVATGPSTGLPIIWGTPIVGQTLTADTSDIKDADGLTSAAFTYNWSTNRGGVQSWVKLSSSDATYTVGPDDEGKTIEVAVIFTDDAGHQERLSSAPTGPVVGVNSPTNNPATGLPSIDGKAQVGGTLTADPSGIADADGLDSATFSYQWIRNDGSTDSDIPGAIGDIYEPDADDEGNAIKVRVTFIDDARNGEILVSEATETVAANPNNPATGAPTINGTPEVGETLTAETSAIADADGLSSVSFNYQWISSDGIVDTDIQGKTESTYTVDADDEANALKVRVTFTDDGGSEETLISAPTKPVQPPGNTPATGTVAISGTAQVGETLTADVSGIADADGLTNFSYRYQWINSDGITSVYIQSAVAATYTLRHSDGGKTIKVRVTFTDDGGTREALTSAATEVVQYKPNTPATGSVSISGMPQVGETLTAVPSTDIHDEDGTGWYRYQWIVNDGTEDTNIPDETGTNYIVRNSNEGKAIKVRLAFTDRANNEESFTSEATDAVAPPPADSFCRRTPQLRDTIVAWVKDNPSAFLFTGLTTDITDCAQVTDDYLPHVTELVLSDSGIDSLQSWDFHGFTYLRSLHLNGNNLSELPDGVFDELRFLRRLYLNDNNLGELPSAVFGDLTSLNVLDLSGNNLSELPDGVFRSRHELKDLRLHDNPGAPFTFMAELGRWEPWGDYGIRVELAPGTPFYMTVTLSAEGGTLSTETVTICCGGTGSHAIRVTPDGDEPVTVSVVSVAFNFRPNRSASGIQVGLGAPLVVPEAQHGNNPATGLPAIRGAAQVGQILTADTSGISDADGLSNVSYNYQWIASNRTSAGYIQNATASTYELSGDDVGKTIRVRVSFSDAADNRESLTTAATEAVLAADASLPNTQATGLPTISGTPQVDETLTADTSAITDDDGLTNVSYRYQWIAGESDIAGATGSAYQLASNEEGKTIRVRVTFTDDADNEETLTSAATVPVAAAPNREATGTPTVSGAPQVGETLTADTSGIRDADGLANVSYRYQWMRSDNGTDTDIKDATDSTYTPSVSDVGKTIKVRVSFTDDADNEETLTSAVTTAVAAKPNTPATGLPTINGTAQVDETLTADTSGIADEDGLDNATFSYQWIRSDGNNDTDIGDQTGSTYTLTDDDVGKTIKVRVSFTDDADNEETLTSAATTAVAATAPTAPQGLTVTEGSQSQELEVSWQAPSSNGGSDVTGYRVQWKESSDSWDTATDVSEATETGTAHTITGLTGGVEYSVRVSAMNGVGEGPVSADVSGIPQPAAIWSATLTVGSAEKFVGYTTFVLGSESPIRGALSSDTITLDDDSHTVKALGVLDGDLILTVTPKPSFGFVLVAGTTEFASTDASTKETTIIQYRWTDPGLDWSDGEEVAVRLTEPVENAPATGSPTIIGTAAVDETLAVDTSGINDADGLTSVSYRYQWIRSDGDTDTEIAGETSSTYTVADDDVGKQVKVRVAFIDDAGNPESLISGTTEVLIDYDADDDGLIEVTTLKQLDAIRHDLDGDGIPTDDGIAAYAAAFPDPVEQMGCSVADVCSGYEIMADLDFDTNRSGAADAGDIYWNDGTGWIPIGGGASEISTAGRTMHNPFIAIFEGNGRTISNLFVDKRGNFLGLFGYVGFDATSGAVGVIRNVNLIDVNVTGDHYMSGLAAINLGVITNSQVTGLVTGVNIVGGLVGENYGVIVGSHVAGCVSGGELVGGLVGRSYGAITNSSVSGCVSAVSYVGGLVGNNYGLIAGSHTAGRVSGHGVVIGGLAGSHKGVITASRSTARVLGTDSGPQSNIIGGLVGDNRGAIAASYATGYVSGEGWVGGLVGQSASAAESPSVITASYATGRVSGTRKVGGLVGVNDGTITASYAAGPVSGNVDVGGLAGTSEGSITASYWDTRTSGHPAGSHGVGKTTAELQAPTGYSGIYETWDLNGDDVPDSPWDLGSDTQRLALTAGLEMDTDGVLDSLWDMGSASQYPALAADLDGAGRVTWQEFGHQLRAGPTLTTTVIPGEDSVELSWTPVDTSYWSPIPTVTYTLYRGHGDAVETIVRDLEGLIHIDDDVTSGETYSYQVVAVVAGGEAVHSALGFATSNMNTPATGAPSISGTPQVDQTLTADTSPIDDADGLTNVSYEYQWMRSDNGTDTDIEDATDSTYTPSVADAGRTIKVRVTFTDDADNRETLTSEATDPVAATAPGVPEHLRVFPHDTGALDVSWHAPASDGGTDVTGYKVEWKESADSWDTPADVSEATVSGTTHTITGLTGGVEYAVRVIATNSAGDGPASAEAKGTPAGAASEQTTEAENSAPTGLPTISGTPQVDQTLTADTSPIDDSDGLTNVSYRYQWIAGGSDIAGATGSSYTLTASEQGKTIQVRVTFTDDADNEETLTSEATVAVAAAANREATGKPGIGGTPQVEETLTPDTSAIDDEDGLTNVSYEYQWLAGGTDIAGATGSAYTLTSSEQGKTIQVRVTFTDDRGNSESLTSEATVAVAAKPVPLTATFSNVPASHSGSGTTFTFDLAFSENFPLSYITLRDHAFSEDDDGPVTRAQRKVRGSNQTWTITVEPQGNGAITVTLPATTDCNDSGAICTSDGRMLSHSLSFTVPGPGG